MEAKGFRLTARSALLRQKSLGKSGVSEAQFPRRSEPGAD